MAVMDTPSRSFSIYIRSALLIVLGVLIAYGGYSLFGEKRTSAGLQNDLSRTQSELADRDAKIVTYTAELDSLRQSLALSEENGSELLRELEDERERNDDFERQIKKLNGTVGDLDKLSKTDQELLQKYSKVYFLNEHYSPPRIKEIDNEFLFRKNEPEYIHAQVAPFLEDLLEDARDDGVDLVVLSGYRSFDEQRSLKGVYTVQYGSGANTFSADQGYSEHQLGTTIDFTTTSIGGTLVTSFETTPEFAWLTKYAHRYGFVLSYPKNNAYYMYEPWHWRFVGTDLADTLHDDNESFYDVDQREIDKYLISIFD